MRHSVSAPALRRFIEVEFDVTNAPFERTETAGKSARRGDNPIATALLSFACTCLMLGGTLAMFDPGRYDPAPLGAEATVTPGTI